MAYTTIDDPTIYFNTKLYTGNGGTNAITLDGSENMQPDWVWLKRRDSSAAHYVWDVVRGAATQLYPASASSEDAGQTNGLSAFGSDGFTLGSDAGPNANSGTYASWNWKAGGSASSNSDGSITSSVSASTTAGFSIVSFTGNSGTVGHGLGVKPNFIVVKSRQTGGSNNWVVAHSALGTNMTDNYIVLNLTDAAGTSTNVWGGEPTSTTFTVSSSVAANDNNIAYCLAEKKGYSKFGSYNGNGNANGTFVYTGFKPAFVMVKRSSATDNWMITDNKRSSSGGNNVIDRRIIPNLANAEYTNTSPMDLLSNGFKHRDGDNINNASGSTYIYLAFAENPIVGSNNVPATAR